MSKAMPLRPAAERLQPDFHWLRSLSFSEQYVYLLLVKSPFLLPAWGGAVGVISGYITIVVGSV